MRMLVLALVAISATPVMAAGPSAPTLKDLGGATIRPGEQVTPDPERARQLYRDLLEQDTTDPEIRAEALRRLGDMAMERGDMLRGEEPGPGAGSAETRAAIDLYGKLLELRPDYPRADLVLYQLARGWEAEGELDQALSSLDRLVTRFPGSVHYLEAQFRRAEILFSAQRWRDAEAAYAAVIAAGPRNEFYDQALYKHGWALFRQSTPDESAGSFLALLDRLLADPASGSAAVPLESLSRADRELVDDTLRALSIQFADLEAGASLDEALAAHGDAPYAWLLYASLGDMLVEKERYTDAADAYGRFVRRDPVNPRAPELQARAIDAYLKGGFADLALAAKQDFVRGYAFDGPFWQQRDRADAPEVVARLKANLQDLARYQHARAQESGAKADYEAAASYYRQYMQSFPDDPDLAATNYLLADLLFESGDFRAATGEFERTAYEYPPNAKSAAAGYAALVSYDKLEEQLTGQQREAWHLASIESSLRFADAFPTHPEAGRMRLRAAQQLFNLGQYDRASGLAAQVTDGGASLQPSEQRTAWNVVADSAFETGRFAEAEGAYREVLAGLPADARERTEISNRLAATVYQQGEARQAAGDVDGAVSDFLRIGTLAPGSEIGVTARFDAAALLVRERQWERAIPVLESLRREHGDHPLAATIPQSLALAYSEAGRPLPAAAEFERIAGTESETAEVRRAALVEAAGLYEKGGDRARAAAAWERFVELYPSPLDEANAVRLKLADFARDAGNAAERTRWLEALVAADAEAGEARTATSRLLAARAALELAVPAKTRFESVALRAPLSRTLKAKRAALEEALGAYQRAADYAVEEVTVAATFATAELYRRLATDLMASERPRNLDPEELEQYDLLLEEQAYPFEERAIELHESNVSRARDGFYDGSLRASFEALAALKPGRYARQETLQLAPVGAEAGAAVAWRGPLGEGEAAAAAGNWDAAEQAFSRALEAGGGAAAMTGLGIAYRETGRFGLAEQAYQSAIQADPTFAPARLNLGVLLDLYLRRPDEALAQYRAYQSAQAEPDARVAAWIQELEIRAGQDATAQGAQP